MRSRSDRRSVESLGPIPARPDGSTLRPRGSLYVDAALTFPSGELFHLYLDCLQGQQVNQGATHTDALPGVLGQFRVPGYGGTVDAAPVTGAVDADLLTGAGPSRAASGAAATLGVQRAPGCGSPRLSETPGSATRRAST